MRVSLRSRMLSSLATGFALTLLVSVVEPLRAAFDNWDELSIGLAELFGYLLRPFALSAAIFVGASAATALIFPRRGLALQAVVLLGLLAQSQFFVWNLGVFDGGEIDWSQHAGKGWLESGFWLLLAGAAWLRPETIGRRSLFVAGLVPALAIASLVASYSRGAPYEAKRISTLEEEADASRLRERVLSYSRERNVIVIVLDAFQSDHFSELLRDPEVAGAMPPGFIFYRNAISHYPVTQLSLPSILTSSTLGESTDMVRWQVEQMGQSVPARLARYRFDATLLSWTPFHLSCSDRVFGYSCLSLASALPLLDDASGLSIRRADGAEDARRLQGVASFRLAPLLLKPWVYNGGRWRVPSLYGVGRGAGEDARIWPDSQRDIGVLRALARHASANSPRPTFKLLHFFGAHLPNSVSGDCEWNGIRNPDAEALPELIDDLIAAGAPIFHGRGVALGAGKCALSLVFRLLARLEELGVYDESLVFILADHGRPGAHVDLDVADPAIEPADDEAQGAGPGRGVPLFLAKRIGARHPLRVSDVPVALCDVPSSIFRELGLPQDFECRSIFELEEQGRAGNPKRSPRIHYLLPKRALRTLDPGIRFDRFRVKDHSWLEDSWVEVPE